MFQTFARLLAVGAMAGTVAVAGIGTASAKSSIDFQVRPHTQHVGQWFSVSGSGADDAVGRQRLCVQERYGARGAWQTVWCGRTVDTTRQEASAYGLVRAGHPGVLQLRAVLEGVQSGAGGRTWLEGESAPVSVTVVR
ncbi:hypothetical protein [Streptacidiphilus jiangxiensis]|uniref:Secreted protein n=1 Tax=Streptacidiphilus jiangxiensis TaxID=235985 RepID=A0A1H7MXR2_STRJI|nr:hypothetical protein [Streptacidiphilus jiangxiensis]SEL15568.1 hypothetical protein SAMN05414137_106102 [Streptacidiphilus jiangxiensis]